MKGLLGRGILLKVILNIAEIETHFVIFVNIYLYLLYRLYFFSAVTNSLSYEVCAPCTSSAHRGQKRALYSPELEL